MNWVSVKPPILTNQRKKIYYHEKNTKINMIK